MEYGFAHLRYRLPFRGPLRTAHGAWTEREGVLVRLTDAQGRRSYGEAAPIPWFGTETVEAIEAVCRDLGSRVDSARLESVPAAVGCLRNALAAAQASLAPWPTGPASLGVAALLPAGRAAVEQAKLQADAGFRVFKWKVGVGPLAEELALFDDLCAELPEGAKVRLDANGAWDRRTAERWLERCAERPVEFVEDPCAAVGGAGSVKGSRGEDLLRGLADAFPTPLALDEPLAGGGDVERWLAASWRGIYVVKPALLADVAATLERLARQRAEVVFSSALETAVGARAALRVAFGWAGTPRALGFGVWPRFADARCDGPPAQPFFGAKEIERIDPEAVWNVLAS